MSDKNHKIQIFNGQKVRTVWNADEEKWYFSIVDVVAVLTDSADPKQYIKKMKMRDPELKNNWGTICTLVELVSSDGKKHKEMTADQKGMFRIIQSIPSPKAEPFKQWMAQVATTVELSKSQNPKGFRQSAKVAHEGGKIAGETRAKIESQTGRSIVSKEKATDYLPPADRWEALPEEDFLEDFFPLPVSAAAGAGAVRMAHCGSCFAAARSILAL